MTIATDLKDYREIKGVIQHYINGAISGRGNEMQPAFHTDATIFGYVGPELFGGPIQGLFEWNDNNGPASNLKYEISRIEVVGLVASVRIELDDWTGHRFTDFFNLLKLDGTWKIMNKVFHTHS